MKNRFEFHGGVISFIGVSIVAMLLTVFTFGIAYPWALCMTESWKIDNTTYKGRKLKFNGTGIGLIGLWIKWLFFIFITFGIYTFWIIPSLQKWIWENTEILGDE